MEGRRGEAELEWMREGSDCFAIDCRPIGGAYICDEAIDDLCVAVTDLSVPTETDSGSAGPPNADLRVLQWKLLPHTPPTTRLLHAVDEAERNCGGQSSGGGGRGRGGGGRGLSSHPRSRSTTSSDSSYPSNTAERPG